MRRYLLTLAVLATCCWHCLSQVRDTVTFAVLGNSISTYYDYIPSGYAIFYNNEREMKYGIQVNDTWWMQLSRVSGMTFLANSSWSGSRVAFTERNNDISPFCSNARLVSLSRNGVPDVVIIAGGTNDWGHNNVPLGEYSTTVFNDSLTFRGAYAMMLNKLQQRYPDTKVVCLSLFPRGDGLTVKNGKGWTQQDANTSIRTIAKQFGCTYVDCSTIGFSSNWGMYTLDYLHPTTAGHKLIADCIRRSLVSQKVITTALASKAEVDEADCLLDLSFDADGIVNKGTAESTVGKHGQASTLYDAERDTYYGCTKAANADFFYATYNQDSPLAEALSQNVTWETLVRLDALVNGSNSCDRVCFLGNEQEGGWAFANTKYAATFTYQHTGANRSSFKCLEGDSIMAPGKFYHLVVTMDRKSHITRYYVNGELIHTGTRCAHDMALPRCGSTAGKKDMWIALGADCVSGTYRTTAEAGAACTFVFARIYDGALTQKGAKALYTDYVRQFTEPLPALYNGVVMDCQFTPDGAANHSLVTAARPIEMMGEVPVTYNGDLKCYEASFDGSRSNFFKFDMGTSPALMRAMADEYSVEVYCQTDKALPGTATKPLGFTNGYGASLQMNTKGAIGFAATTHGFKSNGTAAKTMWLWSKDAMLTDKYTHYVMTYDRLGHLSALYVNGEVVASRTLSCKEGSLFEWAPTEWLAIGGDASGKYDAAANTGSYPFRGRIAMVRIWGRSLAEADVKALSTVANGEEISYTIGSNGYVSCCVPYATTVPEGMQAFVIPYTDGTNAYLREVGRDGEVIPYGTPIIMRGTKGTKFTLQRADTQAAGCRICNVGDNLLQGTFAKLTIGSGQGYYQNTTGAGLYRVASSTSVPAFSCFMPSTLKRSLLAYKDHDEYLDGIGQVGENPGSAPAYNLGGMPVPQWQRGIVIQGGRKIYRR